MNRKRSEIFHSLYISCDIQFLIHCFQFVNSVSLLLYFYYIFITHLLYFITLLLLFYYTCIISITNTLLMDINKTSIIHGKTKGMRWTLSKHSILIA